MFKTLIALDGSPASEQALDLACTLLAGKEAAVCLFHVIPGPLIYGYGEPIKGQPYEPAMARAEAEAFLRRQAQHLRERGIGPRITHEVEIGEPAGLIVGAAERDGTDLIVLGSRGLNVAERFMLGSVSSRVVTHAPCGVLVVHPRSAVSHVETVDQREAVAV